MGVPIVLDTHIFNRCIAEDGEYRTVYSALMQRCDRVLVNTKVADEYVRMAPRAGITATLILGEIIPALQKRGKWERTGNRNVNVGPRQDQPFIGAAMEGRARYIISNDPDLRTNSVHRVLQRAGVEVLFPDEYTRQELAGSRRR